MKNNGMAGVSVNSIDMDDFRGSFCDSGPYPFLRASLGLLMKNAQPSTTEKKNLPSTTAATTPTEYYRPKTTTNAISTVNDDENDIESTTIKPLSRVISKKKTKNSKTGSNRINKKSEQSDENLEVDKHVDLKVNAINKIINSKLILFF